jgi:hypothetical protein
MLSDTKKSDKNPTKASRYKHLIIAIITALGIVAAVIGNIDSI